MSHWLVRITACRAISHSALGQLSANKLLARLLLHFVCISIVSCEQFTRGYSLPIALPASFPTGEGVE